MAQNAKNTGLLGLSNIVEQQESLLNIDFAAIGPIGQTGPTGPTGPTGFTGPTGPTYIYQKQVGQLAYTGTSITIEHPASYDGAYTEISLATAGSNRYSTIRSIPEDTNKTRIDLNPFGAAQNPVLSVVPDGAYLTGDLRATRFKTGPWIIRSNESQDLDIYDSIDTNPVLKVYKDSGTVQVQSNVNNPEIAIANTVYNVNQTAKLKCGHTDAYGYTKSTLIGDNKARLAIGSKNNGGSETDVINIVDGKALINTTTNNGIDALQVNGSVSSTAYKSSNWTIGEDGSNNLQIYDSSDNNPAVVINKVNPKIRITPVVGTPALSGAKLVLYETYGESDVAYSGLGHRTGNMDIGVCDPSTALNFVGGSSATQASTFASFTATNRNLLINKSTDTGEKLQVDGDITCTNLKPATGIVIGNRWTIDNNASNHLSIRDSDNNPNMAFFNTGAITVYQTTPNAQFNISATTAGNLAFFGLYTVSSSAAFRQNDSGSFDFLQNNNGNFSFINGTGRILMGSPTDDGTTKLQVNGDIRNTGAIISPQVRFISSSQPTGAEGLMYFDTTSKTLRIHDGTSWKTVSMS